VVCWIRRSSWKIYNLGPPLYVINIKLHCLRIRLVFYCGSIRSTYLRLTSYIIEYYESFVDKNNLQQYPVSTQYTTIRLLSVILYYYPSHIIIVYNIQVHIVLSRAVLQSPLLTSVVMLWIYEIKVIQYLVLRYHNNKEFLQRPTSPVTFMTVSLFQFFTMYGKI